MGQLSDVAGMPPITSGLSQPKTRRAAEADAANGRLAGVAESVASDSQPAASIWTSRAPRIHGVVRSARSSSARDQQAFDFQADSCPHFRYVGPLLDVPNWFKFSSAKSSASAASEVLGKSAVVRAVGSSSFTDSMQHRRAGPARSGSGTSSNSVGTIDVDAMPRRVPTSMQPI